MTKIIWVTEGLMATHKLAEALKEIRSRECLIVKVSTVQEAICELFEGGDPASLVICDRQLHRSLPKRELREAAELKDVPYLVAVLDKDKREERLLAVQDAMVPEKARWRLSCSNYVSFGREAPTSTHRRFVHMHR
jgi:hypothetical protein